MKRRFSIGVMAGAILWLAASPAMAANMELVKEAAKNKGGEVVVYDILFKPDLVTMNQAFNQAFKKYGLSAKVIRSQSGALANLYKQELRAGKVSMDVIATTDPGMFLAFNRADQLTRFCSPHYKDYYEWAVGKDCGYFYHTSWLQNISYNPNLVKPGEVPTSWLDFHNPKWKGKLSIPDPKIGGGHYYFVFTIYKLFGRDWFVKARNNDVMMVQSHGTTNNKVQAGERNFGVNLSMLTRRDGPYPGGKGAPIREVTPKEGGALLAAPMAVTKNSPNTAGGKVFVEWLSSLEGQKAFTNLGKFSLRKDFTNLEGDDLKKIKYLWWDPEEMDKMREEWTRDSLRILTGQ